MPDAWSDKDERQYQHIKQQMRDDGKTNDEAEEIAARTVNKRRQQQGRTDNATPQGSGNPNTPLPERTRQELYNRAKQLSIAGRSNMNKEQLVNAIRQRQNG
ncbi:Rho termination factor N-terminal domain-containing protein [Idiomarina xiamenensis]|uniref:RelE/ParE family protein n=1 Tax=Idiomarina xiamenensis 10-D-4 TaxID=740709 RepID=K2K5N4_9GAMM|nr:Rho termination factor N-terminal domain-containing protein [Idiomarina xiamenensis]EKE82918.1 RelE/ParE family protein [Idiomarina xiamenensis 10-D-4]